MAQTVGRCVHCGGNLLKEDGTRKCLQCGRTWATLPERHRFYEEHKVEILKDLADIGRAATTKKWQVPPATMQQLIKSWLHEKTPAPAPPAIKDNVLVLPPLPAWSDTWDPTVQLAWFEIYKHPVNGKGKEEVTHEQSH